MEIPYQVLSVSHSHEAAEVLTDRQWEFIRLAVKQGFYDDPRTCTLAELAERLGIHKSAASRLRHRAESRVITSFVSEVVQ